MTLRPLTSDQRTITAIRLRAIADQLDADHAHAVQRNLAAAAARPPGDTPMPTLPENDPGARIQRAINANGLQPPLKIDGQVGPVTADGLDTVLRWLNGQMADLRKANATSADSIKRLTAKQAELLEAAAASDALIERVTMARENAEAEALQLRRQLQEGGRIGQLLADLDAAVEMIDLAIGRARA